MSVSNDFTIHRGTTFKFSLEYKDQSNQIIDLTSATAILKCRDRLNEEDEFVFTLTESTGLAITGNTGTIAATISAAQTALLTLDRYYYDLVINLNGDVIKLLEGKFLIKTTLSV